MTDLRIERGKATRDRLVAAGRKLFGERGYDATPIDAILDMAGVKRGALYHHFETKAALFDAVLDQVIADSAAIAADDARGASGPVASLQAACDAWLRMSLDPSVQRIALLDPPAVVGWTRWREIDEQHTLGGLRRSLERIAADGGLPQEEVDVLAHMLLAAVSEAALMIARAEDPEAALAAGRAAMATLLGRLIGEPS
ncbi:MAG TPA: TetR/AcrR family transcriptional regulator [Thermoleophilaceae bacterium]|nr:TetR/AcrR family transcriptional regulator [Thermoleophilaceae bacterium]